MLLHALAACTPLAYLPAATTTALLLLTGSSKSLSARRAPMACRRVSSQTASVSWWANSTCLSTSKSSTLQERRAAASSWQVPSSRQAGSSRRQAAAQTMKVGRGARLLEGARENTGLSSGWVRWRVEPQGPDVGPAAYGAPPVLAFAATYAAPGVSMQELMKEGRKGVKEIDGTLNRTEKLVEDTLQIGQQVWGGGGGAVPAHGDSLMQTLFSTLLHLACPPCFAAHPCIAADGSHTARADAAAEQGRGRPERD